MRYALVNGFSAKSGGGKVILQNYLKALESSDHLKLTYFVLVPDQFDCADLNQKNIKFVEVPYIYNRYYALPLFYLFWLPRFIRKNNIGVVFNLGDLVLPFIAKQVYFFDWAYLVINESHVWDLMSGFEKLKRKFKIFLIKLFFSNNSIVVAQTRVMKFRLEKFITRNKFKIKNVVEIPTPVNFLGNQDGNLELTIPLSPEKNWKNLLFLASYAPHKNFEIIIPLIEELKSRELDYRLVLTLPFESKHYIRLIKLLEEKNLSEYLVNLGVLDNRQVEKALASCTALFLPTLLESYGIPYLEAMHSNCSIQTSNFDFIKTVCNNAAFYFDPFNVVSICESLQLMGSSPELVKIKKDIGHEIVNQIGDWSEFGEKIEHLLIDVLDFEKIG